MYKTLRIYKNQSLIFQCHVQRNKQKLQSMNSPDSTTSLSGVVAGCGEIQRSRLAVQITMLLFNTQRMWFHLPVTTYKWEVDSQFLPITAVSALGRASTLCSLFRIWNPPKHEPGFHIPPQCTGASMWQGGVTTCVYHKKNGLLSTQLFLQATLCWKSRHS